MVNKCSFVITSGRHSQGVHVKHGYAVLLLTPGVISFLFVLCESLPRSRSVTRLARSEMFWVLSKTVQFVSVSARPGQGRRKHHRDCVTLMFSPVFTPWGKENIALFGFLLGSLFSRHTILDSNDLFCYAAADLPPFLSMA